MDALRKVLNSPSNSNDEEAGILQGLNEGTTLSWSTRIKCFIAFFLLGILMSILGSASLFFGIKRGLRTFAVLYSFGNLFSMGSTMFLMGPWKQLKNMFAPTRLIAVIVVFAALIGTFLAAFLVHNAGLALLMVIIQSLAMTWYSLSYIPYARDIVTRMVTTVFLI